MDNIGIERLCCFGMPPVEFIGLAARLDCRFIGIGLTAMTYYNPHSYPDWSLRSDSALRREMCSAMRDTGVTPSLCEGFAIRPGVEAEALAPDLDLVAELGCSCINLGSAERDKSRAVDQFGAIAELAARRGILVTSEIGMPPLVTLAAGLRLIEQVGSRNFRLLIDTMHFFRMGSRLEDLIGHADAVGYIQLADAPRANGTLSYMEEALYERLPPGSGELPLAELIPLLPPGVVMGVEVPQRSLAAAGVSPDERIGNAVRAARTLISRTAAATVPRDYQAR